MNSDTDTILIARADYNKLHVILYDEMGLPVDEMPLCEMLDALQTALVDYRRLRNILSVRLSEMAEQAKENGHE